MEPAAGRGRCCRRRRRCRRGSCSWRCRRTQVARLQCAERHRGARVLLVGGAVREADADLRVAVHGEAGAVEAARAGPAVHVGDAEVPLRDADDGPSGRSRRGRRPCRRRRRCCRRAAAAAPLVVRRRAPRPSRGRPPAAFRSWAICDLRPAVMPSSLFCRLWDLGLLRRRPAHEPGGGLLVGVELDVLVLDLEAGTPLDALGRCRRRCCPGAPSGRAGSRGRRSCWRRTGRPPRSRRGSCRCPGRGRLSCLLATSRLYSATLSRCSFCLICDWMVGELRVGRVVLLHGDVDLVVDGLELGLHLGAAVLSCC